MAKNNLSFKLALLVREFFKKIIFYFWKNYENSFLTLENSFQFLQILVFFSMKRTQKNKKNFWDTRKNQNSFPKYVKWLFIDRFSNTVRTVLSGKKISKLTKVLEPHLAKLKVSLPKPLFSTALNAKKKKDIS